MCYDCWKQSIIQAVMSKQLEGYEKFKMMQLRVHELCKHWVATGEDYDGILGALMSTYIELCVDSKLHEDAFKQNMAACYTAFLIARD